MSLKSKRLFSLTAALLLLYCGASALLPGARSDALGADASSRIVYESNHNNNTVGELDSVLPNGTDPRVLLFSQRSGLGWPTYSSDHRQIAYGRYLRSGNFEIFVMRADGTHRRQVTHSIEDNELNGSPAFSPNGRRIAYDSNRGTRTTQDHIFLVSSHGGRGRQLTYGSGDDRGPSFSPDGQEIVFSRDRNNYETICVVSVKGGPVRTLAQINNSTVSTDGDPSFSPNGSEIVFQGDALDQVLIMNADGSGLRELAPGTTPSFSPSGGQIVYVGGKDSSYGIYTMNSDGTDQQLIVPVVAGSETELNSPSW